MPAATRTPPAVADNRPHDDIRQHNPRTRGADEPVLTSTTTTVTHTDATVTELLAADTRWHPGATIAAATETCVGTATGARRCHGEGITRTGQPFTVNVIDDDDLGAVAVTIGTGDNAYTERVTLRTITEAIVGRH